MRAVKSGGRLSRIASGALLVVLLACLSSPARTAAEQTQKLKPEVRRFIDGLVRTHGFDAAELTALFENARVDQGVLRAISTPATSRPWYKFRSLVIDDAQIAEGLRFWNENAAQLSRARREFGVPEAIVVALIGIESRYGTHAGGHGVFDALYTLSFEWPKRADYFRGELEQFLVLAREQGWDPATLQGSFAGALGWPQFMPGNYRRFAVDYDGDGRVDLWADMADIVGSVASYLRQFGWKEGQPVAVPARIDSIDPKVTADLGLKRQFSLGRWRERGVVGPSDIPDVMQASLFALEFAEGQEYWFAFENFQVLLRYNYSRNYVMAVHQLAEAIGQARDRAVFGAE